MTIGRIIVLAAALPLLAACYTKGEYLKMEQDMTARVRAASAQYDECQGRLEQCGGDKAVCEKDLAKMTDNHQLCMAVGAKTGEELKALGAEYAEKQAQLDALKRANDSRQQAMDMLFAKFAALISSGRLSIGVNDGRMVIQLSSNVLFAVGRADLSKDGSAAVTEVAEVLRTIPDRKFQVAGHTDNQKAGGRINPNWTLSYERARSVFDLLVKTGVDESLLSLAAYAEYSPVAANDTPEGQEANRRIEIVLLPTSDELPLKQIKKIEAIRGNP